MEFILILYVKRAYKLQVALEMARFQKARKEVGKECIKNKRRKTT